MSSRLARDDEVAAWCDEGWVLLDGLIGADEIDAAAGDLAEVFPTAEQYHADPDGETERWRGRPPAPRADEYVWPAKGPGFRPEQHRWRAEFPFAGTGALSRLCVHPSIVDFMERVLETDDLRVYQTGMSAKYTGAANYEQPMHTDRNHSWLPPRSELPWLHVESFLYLSDVGATCAPTHLVSVRDSVGRDPTVPLVLPRQDPELYGAERPAMGPRGSLLVYRPDVFHRGVDIVEPGGARFLMNVAYKRTGHDWVGFDTAQSRASSPAWTTFVEGSTPRELALFGFPEPGHAIWNEALLDATARKYPNLDLAPWRRAISR
ncbi:MAG: hypothetical protein EXQ79_04995 [Acidimicrobiia bacterium]|nr:hypothetical protein [Acidimicrobiia bacterium]